MAQPAPALDLAEDAVPERARLRALALEADDLDGVVPAVNAVPAVPDLPEGAGAQALDAEEVLLKAAHAAPEGGQGPVPALAAKHGQRLRHRDLLRRRRRGLPRRGAWQQRRPEGPEHWQPERRRRARQRVLRQDAVAHHLQEVLEERAGCVVKERTHLLQQVHDDILPQQLGLLRVAGEALAEV